MEVIIHQAARRIRLKIFNLQAGVFCTVTQHRFFPILYLRETLCVLKPDFQDLVYLLFFLPRLQFWIPHFGNFKSCFFKFVASHLPPISAILIIRIMTWSKHNMIRAGIDSIHQSNTVLNNPLWIFGLIPNNSRVNFKQKFVLKHEYSFFLSIHKALQNCKA